MGQKNIIQFIDLGLVDKSYLVMGFAIGGDLEDQNRYKPFTMREIALILRQMLDALVYLHVGFNIIHRDIKPANILCETRSHFRLADFGLAKEGQVLETIKGTRPYMAPEMFANKPYSAAVDLWVLGWSLPGFCRTSALKVSKAMKIQDGVQLLSPTSKSTKSVLELQESASPSR